MILLVSYDLNGKERPSAYRRVAQTIDEKAIDWRRPLYSQWFVETAQDPDTWVEWLKPVLDQDDRLFVSRVTMSRQGMLTDDDWKWLRSKKL